MNKIIGTAGMKLAYGYLNSNPEKNIPRLMNLVDRMDRKNTMEKQRKTCRAAIEDKNNNWYKLILSMWPDVAPGVRRAFFNNFILNENFIGFPLQAASREKYGCNIPWAILMDPTSACNLKCTGCWAAEYGNKLSMSYETLDDIIRQGKKLGVYLFIYSGGEPLVRKADIIRLCEKHSDCQFLAFTNGTLIDEAFTDEMLRVKNFIPAISIEGFEEATDFRRGEGTYQAVVRAMTLLKRKKLIFGASLCYTRYNTEVIGSEEFFDFLVDQGAKFAWFFTYMPVGAHAVPDLMVTPEQREFMYRQIRHFRQTKPLFTMDFWNDGEYTQGCIAGGRRYLHINAAGDIEPCAFIHYADSSIYKKTLLEALKSPLFMQYHKNQPFNGNHLRPCPLLDNPTRLIEMVEAAGAASTDFSAPEDVRRLGGKCMSAAEKWAVTADRLWGESHTCAGCAGCAGCAVHAEESEIAVEAETAAG
ncbi:Radical SAM superfamily enzyme, MoaA/NifB/PqqE/SkfB family [Sporobacter termitidis DSM 10068]|uniref:Radical SAM superfamily enzyme, MoaA/NifB/PqqE/SkfB family n=1 Tax=Sporobacter termitidis DSM 10068 TaxID=1123282 RepID=A0A1M5XJI7_9FIRM|nr:radical SAM protein [Sporobacter termitidis]SHH99433.1 Radical SAM superfamily enzyme, MoaA/NifB/PqqE/SkfB family [Sporobacter termitidis DSM 10068]